MVLTNELVNILYNNFNLCIYHACILAWMKCNLECMKIKIVWLLKNYEELSQYTLENIQDCIHTFL